MLFRLTPILFVLTFFFVIYCEESSGELLQEEGGEEEVNEEKPHERFKLFNWDYKDLGTPAFEDLLNVARQPIGFINTSSCPDGWFHFSDSCYYVEHELLGFAKAEQRCFEKKATLFVANSFDEWDAIRLYSPKAFFSWIGLIRFSQYEKTESLPRWQTEGAINPSKINWLIKPYKPIVNGWTTYANCVGYYNSPVSVETTSYSFYYPCTLLLNSICERNATLINTSYSLN